jgi:hypothetical protein
MSVIWSQGKDKLQLSVVGFVPRLRPFDGGESATCTFITPLHVVNLCSFFNFHHFFSRRQIFLTPSNVGTHTNAVGLEY